MKPVALQIPNDRPLRLLCIGAHCDDIEIGAGGTVLTMLERHPGAHVRYGIFTGDEIRRNEAERSAAAFLAGAGSYDLRQFGLREGFMPYDAAPAKEAMAGLAQDFEPDLILTHRRGEDRHQDHALLGQLTWQTFRNNLILEYEVAKYEGDLTTPNVYVPLSPAVATKKVALLFEYFQSQRSRYWFTEENFMALMRLRGLEARSGEDFAEGFHASKSILTFDTV